MTPEIAVVVPTARREARLAFLLDALAEQSLPRARFEVVIVRDAGQPAPATVPPDGLDVRFLTAPPTSGPTNKRNVGWRSATAPLVAFTDDDCRPSPTWLQRLIASADEGHFLQGRTEPDPDERHLLRGHAKTRSVSGPSAWYPGCNVAYPRSLLELLEGFDESFVFGSEDTDLALRAQAQGARPRYVNDAVVWHAVLSRSALTAARDAFAAPTFPLLFARHPDQRRHLYLGVFRNREHAAVILGLAGLLVARRSRGLAAAAWLPYLAGQVRGNLVPGRRTPRAVTRLGLHIPGKALVDLAEVAATIAGGAARRVIIA